MLNITRILYITTVPVLFWSTTVFAFWNYWAFENNIVTKNGTYYQLRILVKWIYIGPFIQPENEKLSGQKVGQLKE